MDRICCLLSGRVAEEVFFNEVLINFSVDIH